MLPIHSAGGIRAWAGKGRPRTPGGFWQLGDALLGDPPHERQGWYSVYDEDREMSQLITRTAARIQADSSAFYGTRNHSYYEYI